MAFTTTVLSWGLIQYSDAYKHVGEMDNCKRAIKWATDYFIKCHVQKNVLYGQASAVRLLVSQTILHYKDAYLRE